MKIFSKKKHDNEKIVAISCHTAPIAKIASKYSDILLVGDTVGMIIYGHTDTKSVTMDMMINHGKAVKNAASDANYVVIDMPFGSYENNKDEALINAKRLLNETGADAVKLEGGVDIKEVLNHLKNNDIPVVGHIGLLPQQIDKGEDYRVQGRIESQKQKIKADLNLLLELDIKLIVIECVYKDFADELIKDKDAIFIGIGASDKCDGQILVADDIIGLSYELKLPKFSKSYLDANKLYNEAFQNFACEIKNKVFPSLSNLYIRKIDAE
jgi:3-methyl-2-oxobutanoate hydroxymethyltransferase